MILNYFHYYYYSLSTKVAHLCGNFFLVLDLLHVRNKLSRTNTRLAPKPPKNQHHLNSIWRICTRLKFHLDSDTFAPLYLGPACALPSANVGQWPPPGTAESWYLAGRQPGGTNGNNVNVNIY